MSLCSFAAPPERIAAAAAPNSSSRAADAFFRDARLYLGVFSLSPSRTARLTLWGAPLTGVRTVLAYSLPQRTDHSRFFRCEIFPSAYLRLDTHER